MTTFVLAIVFASRYTIDSFVASFAINNYLISPLLSVPSYRANPFLLETCNSSLYGELRVVSGTNQMPFLNVLWRGESCVTLLRNISKIVDEYYDI